MTFSAETSEADWETPCPTRVDGRHCTCWYDGEFCCGCGDDSGPINHDRDPLPPELAEAGGT